MIKEQKTITFTQSLMANIYYIIDGDNEYINNFFKVNIYTSNIITCINIFISHFGYIKIIIKNILDD